ncbi:MAG: precorrin-6y C5,15-methyltransferase (decarboxylating) subunit CbiE [Ezakiella sp.]|uniref:precorrin-6y C5,15-methyltransferase (decarboxylating) subunit CbiE n=1 Tax=Ezakiella sp. TaxID=1935205 RepID=UPI00297B5ACD|nr:precorrin-6y C5,15-methyltransferase (decarboxylating) subunit CbiE [Ezakiella sp.]MDD7732065.1 precorrin-6y C5,15-methyltransferase (decarboxylating) subunit CbiE [Eubacteriales bacterium]MDY6080227.1 precorrin-6y C5,15-methyltransferase (decarboxylating) subunit CbiE [Ezakiella sp.]
MIYVVGIGPGDPKYLTNVAEDIIFKSDYVLSYKRVKETIEPMAKIIEIESLKEITDFLDEHMGEDVDISVLASGDPSFFGIGEYISKRYKVKTIPGISCVSYMAGYENISLNDVTSISFHGRELNRDLISNDKLMIYTDSKNNPDSISKWLYSEGYRGKIVVGFNLSYDDEAVDRYEIGDDIEIKSDLNLMYVEILNESN